MLRTAAFSLTFVVCAAIGTSNAAAQSKSSSADDAQQISLEVTALQSLSHLELSVGQLQDLLRLTSGAASTPRSAGQTKVTPTFVKTLKALRKALLEDDEEAVDDLK